MAAKTTNTEYKQSKEKKEEVFSRLEELFGSVLDFEIIQSVTYNCDFDLQRASEILIDMTKNVNVNIQQSQEARRWEKCNKETNKNAVVTEKSEKVIDAVPGKMDPNLYSLPHKKTISQNSVLRGKSKKELDVERVIAHIKQEGRVLILLRGLPGSGKSELAKYIVKESVGMTNYQTFILSSDDMFMQRGVYRYDPVRIPEAHQRNQQRAYEAMRTGVSPVIIDNTNMQMWEMKPYAVMAASFGYYIEIIEPCTHWAFNDRELARKNVHGVPRNKIKEMMERYEKNITPQKMFAMYSLTYTMKPPVMRDYPSAKFSLHYKEMTNGFRNYNNANSTLQSSPPKNSRAIDHAVVNHTGHFGLVPDVNNRSQKVQNEAFPRVKINDLMNFDEVSSALITTDFVNDDYSQNSWSTVDSILMHTDSANANLLEPSMWELNAAPDSKSSLLNAVEPEVKKAHTFVPKMRFPVSDSSKQLMDTTSKTNEEAAIKKEVEADSPPKENLDRYSIAAIKEKCVYPKLDLASWGLTEAAPSIWESWGVVTPLKNPKKDNDLPGPTPDKSKENHETIDSSTNTCSADFALLLPGGMLKEKDVNIVEARSRDINIGNVQIPPLSPPKKALLDKGCMTNNDVLSAVSLRERKFNEAKHMNELVCLFPNISADDLRHVYERCGKDINWTVDLLLDDSNVVLNISSKTDATNSENYVSPGLGISDSLNGRPCFADKEECTENEQMQQLTNSTEKITINSRSPEPKLPKKKCIDPEEATDLKKHIEDAVNINHHHYSNHILKIKNAKYGTIDSPGTSSFQMSSLSITDFEPFVEVINNDLNPDLDVSEIDIDFPQNDDESPNEEEEEMMELNIGNKCVSQLEGTFGNPGLHPEGFLPVVQVPKAMARQIYAFYLESVFRQMEVQNEVLETIMKQDEEFAKQLHAQEQEHFSRLLNTSQDVNLREIMDEEAANRLYRKEIDKWKKLTPDDLASKLTRQKLFNVFPTIDKDALLEILNAHDNSYQQTVEVLLASTGSDLVNDPDGTLKSPPISEATINDMKIAEEESNEIADYTDDPKTASSYREEAARYLKKRQELFQKAQQASQRGQYEVALFYSDLAKKQTQHFDQTNNLAAAAFLSEHSKVQNFDTLDLHYLYVKEAIPALDMFLDRNIMLLRGGKKNAETLYVITGRGKRNFKGISRIKPAVSARLRKRKISYVEMNPGLLKIRLLKNSTMTSDLP